MIIETLRRQFSSYLRGSGGVIWQSPQRWYSEMGDKSTNVPQLLINCLRNNIFLCLSSSPGQTLFSLSSGQAGFPGTQKTSPKAALAMLDALAGKLRELRVDMVRINFRGLNPARPVIIGQLRRMGIKIAEVMDSTGVPHNGCRPPKKKRL